MEGAMVRPAVPFSTVFIAAALSVACGGDPAGPGEPGPTVTPFSIINAIPLVGTPNRELFYGAYFQHFSGSGIVDYQCGPKVFENHRRVDVLLQNFAVQDSGVTVQAVAPGLVLRVDDGFFDRQTQRPSPGGFGNHVRLRHASGFTTIYGHLRNNSVLVAVNDSVNAGDALGLVGSSGNSNWPHLHFEVQRGGVAVDPYTGPCHSVDSLWQSQLAYQDSFMVLDGGMTDPSNANLARLLERPDDVDTVRTSDDTVLFWAELFNIQADALRFRLSDPAGQLFKEFNFGAWRTFSVTFAALPISVAGSLTDVGTWTLNYHQVPAGSSEFELIWTQQFELVADITTQPLRGLPNDEERGKLVIWEGPADGPSPVIRRVISPVNVR